MENSISQSTKKPSYKERLNYFTVYFLAVMMLFIVASAGATFFKRSPQEIYDASVQRYNEDLEELSRSYIDLTDATRDLAIEKFDNQKTLLSPNEDNTDRINEIARLEKIIRELGIESEHLKSGEWVLDIQSLTPGANGNGKPETYDELERHVKENFTKLTYNLGGTHFVRFVENYRIDRIKEVGSQNSINPEDLVALCLVEGFFVDQRVPYSCHDLASGPGGELGAFQIHPQHREAIKNAHNFDFSLDWTVERMNRLGYQKNSFTAISRHNGDGLKAEEYANKVVSISQQIKDQI